MGNRSGPWGLVVLTSKSPASPQNVPKPFPLLFWAPSKAPSHCEPLVQVPSCCYCSILKKNPCGCYKGHARQKLVIAIVPDTFKGKKEAQNSTHQLREAPVTIVATTLVVVTKLVIVFDSFVSF